MNAPTLACPPVLGRHLLLDMQGVTAARLTDAVLIERVLVNLLSNGMRYSPRDSTVTLRVARCEGNHVAFSVADQGPGFVPQAAFDSGRLGLAFMRERVRLLGGAFEVASEPGRGTRILARLPLSLEETARA